MNKLHTILVFGAIFAAGLGAVSVNDQAISAFITPTLQESNSVGITMLGHVEFVVHNSEGNIVQYAQGDNLITTTGSDCIASEIFGGTLGDCGNIGTFDFIAIGNGTGGTVAVGDSQLHATGGNGFSSTGAVHNGEMARKQATVTPDVTGTDTVITLVNSDDPFTFTSTNATVIRQSGLYSEGGTTSSTTGETTAFGTSELLAIQDLSPTVTVTNGDSLTVTWVVTIGSGP